MPAIKVNYSVNEMNVEKIAQYIKELDAIKNFEQVKKENSQLLQTTQELTGELSNITQEKKNLENTLNEKEQETKGLREKLKATNETLQKRERETTRLTKRVVELERLKTTVEGKTLREAEKALLTTMEDEVNKRSDKAFKSMKTGWAASDKPNDVFNAAIKLLESTIQTISTPGPHFFRKELADIGLPEKVKEIITSDVEKRVNEEFQEQVESKSDQKALEKLNNLKSAEWPQWYRDNIDPKARELEKKIVANALNQIQGPWEITCDKCNTKRNAEFTSQGIEDLLRNGYAMVECSNPNCKDIFSRHQIIINLETLIAHYLTH